jgi:hypothetical protein
MHIIGAIAFRALALRCAKAMITQMGFHAMPSAVGPVGCVTQLVNPLSAFSLKAGRRIPLVRVGWIRSARRRGPHPAGDPARRPRHPGAPGPEAAARRNPAGRQCRQCRRDREGRLHRGSGPARGRNPALPGAAVAAPRPASVALTMAGPAPIGPSTPVQPLQPNAAPHSPRRAVMTAPFMCRPAWPQCTCSTHFPYHGFHGVIR